MLKAWICGVMLILVAYGVWFATLFTKSYISVLAVVLWISPALAALLVSYLSPERKIIAAISMAPVAAILAVLSNFAYQLSGNQVDFSGVQGAVILFAITLIYGVVGAAIGGVAGKWLSKAGFNA